jgi:hypothetical protein
MLQPPEAMVTMRWPWLKLHRLHVEIGVFPDLRIDEAGEQQGEQTFGQTLFREGLVAEERCLEFPVLAEAGVRCKFRHK